MRRGPSPGLRAAIGFLRVFELFAGLWYLAGIVAIGVRCMIAASVIRPVSEGIREFGLTWLMVFGLGLVFTIRSGARAMAEDLELSQLTGARRSRSLLREWAWGCLQFFVGTSAGVFAVQGVMACWLLTSSTFNDARATIGAGSGILAVAGWWGLYWIRKRSVR